MAIAITPEEIVRKELERRVKISKSKLGKPRDFETRKKISETKRKQFANMKKTVNAQTGLEGQK